MTNPVEFFSTKEFIPNYAYMYHLDTPPKKEFLGTPKPNRKCFFCGNKENETLFKGESHIIPKGLGNRYLFTNEECLACNQRAGRNIENDFIKAVEPFRLFSQQMAKKIPVKLKKHGVESYFKGMTEDKTLGVMTVKGKNEILEELDKNKILIKAPLNTYRPISVPKELARLGFLVSSNLRDHKYDYLRKWINGDYDIFPAHYCTLFNPGRIFTATFLMILEYVGKYKNELSPKYVTVLSFGCITMFYYFLPHGNGLFGAWPLPSDFLKNNSLGSSEVVFKLIHNNDKVKNDWMHFEVAIGKKL